MTSKDLISRQQAIDAINHICPVETEYDCTLLDRVDVKCVLSDLPSVQPERKKGKWIRHDEVKNVYGGICIECPECGEKYVVRYIEDEKYCRNCGADMRGEQNDN